MKTNKMNRRKWMQSILAAATGFSASRLMGQVNLAENRSRFAGILVPATSFENHGGWLVDTEFIEIMGSPYLMAHGLGVPVPDATTTVHFPETGVWHVWVRTKDWTARWNATGSPGAFQLLVDGKPVKETFGVKGKDWQWHAGGKVQIDQSTVSLALHDLTGFNGRCDAVYFSQDAQDEPPNELRVLESWRQAMVHGSAPKETLGSFDFVVAGGGYASMCAALAASRLGLKVALIQNRPVLGGNASSEIRVPLRGLIPLDGPYSNLGKIVSELQFDENVDSRQATEVDDKNHEKIIRKEENLHLFLNHHVVSVEIQENRLSGLNVLDVRSGCQKDLKGRYFADCTGHATLGALAGAEYLIGAFDRAEFRISREKPLMGMTNKWLWEMTREPQSFPDTPWALDLTMNDFPLHKPGYWGNWLWESGFYKHPIDDLEYIRDWNFRAVFGAWNAVKNKEKSKEYRNARLAGLLAIGGPRESRRLVGDYLLTAEDMVRRVRFDDGFVPVSWHLDRHIPDERYNARYPDDPFIARGWHALKNEARPRHNYPWWGIPYRCLYSRNIDNLFMAGRNISTDYVALGAVRVMRTCGMMGEVIGKAAAVCADKGCRPRDVYYSHLGQLKRLI